jgi:hypothetical protein
MCNSARNEPRITAEEVAVFAFGQEFSFSQLQTPRAPFSRTDKKIFGLASFEARDPAPPYLAAPFLAALDLHMFHSN